MATTPATTPVTTKDRSAVRTLLRLWPYVRPVRARLLTAAVVAVLASCTGLVIPLVLKWMVDGPVADRDGTGVWLGALYLLLLGCAEALLFGLRRWLVARPLSHVEAEMRADLYRRLQRLPVSFHDRWASGQLLSRGTTDLMLLRMFLAFPLTFLLVNSVTIVVGVVIMLVQDWSLGLVILVPAVPVMVTCVVFERRYSLVARRAQDQVGDLTTVVEESVLGIRIIKGFGRHRSQARAFRELSGTLRGTELHKARLLSAIWAVIVTLPELAIGAALVLGTMRVADGDLSAGTLVAFLSTALALRWPVDSIGFLLAMSQDAATATERYFEVLDEAPEAVGEAPPGAGPTTPAGSSDADRGLRFHDVSFRYPDAPADSAPVLDRVDLHIRPGESMALVGTTGSGKTTLTALVPRLHEVTSGRITLDGHDIAALPRQELRAMVAVAFEEPTLFSASVGDNVLMGAGDEAGEAELRHALSVAQADFVHTLPQGTDTQVGEQGLSLSGGQRQRLALARSLITDPEVLVLDEPTSAVDSHTEARIADGLRELRTGRTTVVFTSSPLLLDRADRVVLVHENEVVAVGAHRELVHEEPRYRAVVTRETDEEAARHGQRTAGSERDEVLDVGHVPATDEAVAADHALDTADVLDALEEIEETA
jgi:ATP-binding cassette, subfamily B, bacterial